MAGRIKGSRSAAQLRFKKQETRKKIQVKKKPPKLEGSAVFSFLDLVSCLLFLIFHRRTGLYVRLGRSASPVRPAHLLLVFQNRQDNPPTDPVIISRSRSIRWAASPVLGLPAPVLSGLIINGPPPFRLHHVSRKLPTSPIVAAKDFPIRFYYTPHFVFCGVNFGSVFQSIGVDLRRGKCHAFSLFRLDNATRWAEGSSAGHSAKQGDNGK